MDGLQGKIPSRNGWFRGTPISGNGQTNGKWWTYDKHACKIGRIGKPKRHCPKSKHFWEFGWEVDTSHTQQFWFSFGSSRENMENEWEHDSWFMMEKLWENDGKWRKNIGDMMATKMENDGRMVMNHQQMGIVRDCIWFSFSHDKRMKILAMSWLFGMFAQEEGTTSWRKKHAGSYLGLVIQVWYHSYSQVD